MNKSLGMLLLIMPPMLMIGCSKDKARRHEKIKTSTVELVLNAQFAAEEKEFINAIKNAKYMCTMRHTLGTQKKK